MDTKREIKEEDPLSDDVAPRNEREFFIKFVTMETNYGAVVLDDDCGMEIKTEIKTETPFPGFCSWNEKECATKHLEKQIKSETVTSINIGMKAEIEEQTLVSNFGSQNVREFLPVDPVMKIKEYNSDHEMENKIQIKEETWWQGTESSSVCDGIKDGDFPPAKSSRLCMEAVSGNSHVKSLLPSTEIAGREISFYNEKDHPGYESQKCDVTKIPIAEEYVHSEQFGKYSDGEVYSRSLYSKQKNLIHKDKGSLKCNICGKGFQYMSDLKRHELIHGGERPHKCKLCDKSYTQLSSLKVHNLIHEGKMPHHCKICDKSFTHLLSLKVHNFIHEDKKPYQCKICNKSFTQLSHLKTHNLIHEGKKPHQCKICDKIFTQLSHLKVHNLKHEGKKPYQCKTCDKSFSQLSNMKRHNLIHEGKKPHQCKTCDKSFTQVTHLKRHNLVHEGKKPY